MRVDLSKQQLSIQSVSLRLQEAQEKRLADSWKYQLADIENKDKAAKDSGNRQELLNPDCWLLLCAQWVMPLKLNYN